MADNSDTLQLSYSSDGKTPTRTITVRGTEYDFGNNPRLFELIFGVTIGCLIGLVVLPLLLLGQMVPGFDGLMLPLFISIVFGLIVWFPLGFLKYKLTGSAYPFFTLNITKTHPETDD
jgi:hypothetical protein